MTQLTSIRGMPDVLPDESRLHRLIMETTRREASLFGFEEIKTPLLESLEVFKRAVGEETDIVQKEMYTLLDRGDRPICLRPEGTAGVMRAVLEHKLYQTLPLRLFYAGPMFRYERPQAGRLRQFTQVGVEQLGDASPLADAEIISLGYRSLKALGISDITLEINTLGDQASRDAFREALLAYYAQHEERLSADSQRRLKTNPLRILDSKDPTDQEINQKAPCLNDFLTPQAHTFFQHVQEGLHALEVPFELNPHLVRGLDYYSHTAFEFKSRALGAQSTVLAGGRYDGLSPMMGGPALSGIGWAAGVERLALILRQREPLAVTRQGALLIPVGANECLKALSLAQDLRASNMEAMMHYEPSLKKGLKKADKAGVRWALLLGEDEMRDACVMARDLVTGHQHTLPWAHLPTQLMNLSQETGSSA